MVGQVLGAVALAALADGDIKRLVWGEGEAGAVVIGGPGLDVLAKNNRQTLKAGLAGIANQPGAGNCGAACAAGARFRIRQEDLSGFGEIRIERDVEQAALAFGLDGRNAGDRLGLECAHFDQAQAAGALGDEDGAVGQKGQRPGVFEAADGTGDFDRAGFGPEGFRRGGAGKRDKQGGCQGGDRAVKLFCFSHGPLFPHFRGWK